MAFIKELNIKHKIALGSLVFIILACCVFLFVNLISPRAEVKPPEEPAPTIAPTPLPTPIPIPTPTPEPEVEEVYYEEEDPEPVGLLTGLPIYEGYVNRRPVAVVINNHFSALPQSGMVAADVVYEVLSEGDITRLIAFFQSEIPEKIGPIRSTRCYFADFAMNHDAVFVHHGWTQTGILRLLDYGVDRMDGMDLEGRVFWRDRSFPGWMNTDRRRALEHSSFSGWERILGYMESREMRADLNEGDFGFQFGDIAVAPKKRAERVTVPFSTAYARHFVFIPEAGHYIVENRNGPHLEAETGEPLTVKNVLIQITGMRVVEPRMGYREVDTLGTGRGYLATGGRVFTLRWEKEAHNEPMRWYFECGTPLVLTPGRTWINVLQNTAEPVFTPPEPIPANIPILMYHAASENNPGPLAELYVRPSVFEQQLVYLIENGFTFVTFCDWDELYRIENPIMLTFDDGYLCTYTEIFPLLQKHNARMVLFLTWGNIRDNGLTAEMVRRMHDSGLVAIEAHTLTHPDLTTVNETRLRHEMAETNRLIEELTGRVPVALAYPAGRFNAAVKEMTAQYYHFGLRHDLGMHNTALDDFEIRRIRISRSTNMSAFSTLVRSDVR